MRKKFADYEVAEIVKRERREAALEAQEIGFDLGKQAQRELYAQSEKPVSKEAEHTVTCPNCKSEIHIPCINYLPAPKESV